MAHGFVIGMDIGAGAQLFEAQLVISGQPGQHFIGAQAVLFEVEFAAIAGRKNRRLPAAGALAQLL
jgi:hypothetical protein